MISTTSTREFWGKMQYVFEKIARLTSLKNTTKSLDLQNRVYTGIIHFRRISCDALKSLCEQTVESISSNQNQKLNAQLFSMVVMSNVKFARWVLQVVTFVDVLEQDDLIVSENNFKIDEQENISEIDKQGFRIWIASNDITFTPACNPYYYNLKKILSILLSLKNSVIISFLSY